MIETKYLRMNYETKDGRWKKEFPIFILGLFFLFLLFFQVTLVKGTEQEVRIEIRKEITQTISLRSPNEGWKEEQGSWYYYRGNTKCYGWLLDKDSWYYLDRQNDGAMVTYKTMQIGDNLYSFLGNGTMAKGWAEVRGCWYYASEGGSLKTGWLSYQDRWYYLDPYLGIMAANKMVNVAGQTFYLNKDGIMLTQWFAADGKWYYANASGALIKGFITLENGIYYLKEDYSMAAGWENVQETYYYFNGSGKMQTGWLQSGNSWYYLASNGIMVTDWKQLDGHWYYFKLSGEMATGWWQVGEKWYFFMPDGSMLKGWANINQHTYYFKENGELYYGWLEEKGKYYYFNQNGAMNKGWLNLNHTYYYCKEDGTIVTGWQYIDKAYYYFSPSGAMATGWAKIKDEYYYLGYTGAMVTGWLKEGNTWYYLKGNGVMATAWEEIGGKWYYFLGDGRMHTSWLNLSDSWYYLKEDGSMATGWIKDGKDEYYLNSSGIMQTNSYINGKYYVDASGKYKANEPPEGAIGSKTVKGLLLNAMQPIGRSLYIYGGAHDHADATRIGVNPNWFTWFKSQGSDYNHKDYEYKYGYGLDCSGYVGWSIYNTVNKKSGGTSLTTVSTGAPEFYSKKGWGTYSYVTSFNPTFKPGDIVSIVGHTWIVVGQCEDGSLVIAHATPKYTQLAATVDYQGNYSSDARKLVQKYVPFYFGEAYNKFGSKVSTLSKMYVTNVNRFQWKTSGGGILSDPDNYQNKTAEQVLKDMFST